MLKVLKFSTKDDYKIFAMADFHENHDKSFIYEKRKFKSVDEHDKVIKERWNTKVTNKDVCILLGDNTFGAGAKERLFKTLNELNYSTLVICAGNHYSGFKNLYFEQLWEQFRLKDQEVYPLYWDLTPEKTVIFVPNLFNIMIDGKLIVCCHFPLRSWEHQAHDSHHWTGHVHGAFKDLWPDGKGKAIDLGVEVFGGPVEYTELKAILDKKEFACETGDHHKKE